MGEYAQDAIERGLTEELALLDYDMGFMSTEEAYERGIVDEQGFSAISSGGPRNYDLESLENWTRELSAQFDRAEMHSSATALTQQEYKHLCRVAAKHSLAWTMRLGMAQQLVAGRPLSIKQQVWMETNWCGGTVKFVQEISKQPTKFIELLTKRLALIKKLAEQA